MVDKCRPVVAYSYVFQFEHNDVILFFSRKSSIIIAYMQTNGGGEMLKITLCCAFSSTNSALKGKKCLILHVENSIYDVYDRNRELSQENRI